MIFESRNAFTLLNCLGISNELDKVHMLHHEYYINLNIKYCITLHGSIRNVWLPCTALLTGPEILLLEGSRLALFSLPTSQQQGNPSPLYI